MTESYSQWICFHILKVQFIAELLRKQDQRTLVLWATDCAEHILPYFEQFVEFIENCKYINKDSDIMIEAKKKDFALYDLVKSIKNLKKGWKWIDSSTFEL